MSEIPATSGNAGFWLHDRTRGMNLAVKEKTQESAFVAALTYYQRRLTEVENALSALQSKVDLFVGSLHTPEETED
jgi:hypothetical protein